MASVTSGAAEKCGRQENRADWGEENGTGKSKPSLDRLATGHPTLTSALRDRCRRAGARVPRYTGRLQVPATAKPPDSCLRLLLFCMACAFAARPSRPNLILQRDHAHPIQERSPARGPIFRDGNPFIINTATDPSTPPSSLGIVACSLVYCEGSLGIGYPTP